LDSFSFDVITRRRALSTEALAGRHDLLSRFMELQVTAGEIDDEYLKNIVINFILAGRDTTSNALSWLFYSLCKEQRVYATLVEELNGIEKGDPNYQMLKAANTTKDLLLPYFLTLKP